MPLKAIRICHPDGSAGSVNSARVHAIRSQVGYSRSRYSKQMLDIKTMGIEAEGGPSCTPLTLKVPDFPHKV